jgi:hypothetical protein
MGVCFDAVERVVRVRGAGQNGIVLECVVRGQVVAVKVLYNYGHQATMVSDVYASEYVHTNSLLLCIIMCFGWSQSS